MFDTHCHLNFGAFDQSIDDVVMRAREQGVAEIMIPSTNLETSRKAVELAKRYTSSGVLCAVGIHPHHVFELKEHSEQIEHDLKIIQSLLSEPVVQAVGEVGLDRHYYKSTKYSAYQIDQEFMKTQILVFRRQVEMAVDNSKSLILHNREARDEFLQTLSTVWSSKLEWRTVFHCCEPSKQLLSYAKEHNIMIGVDGDVTYYKEKQDFVRTIPLEMLVLETDAPFLSPEPFRSQPRETRPPNEPANISLIAQKIAELTGRSVDEVTRQTTENAHRLFALS